MIDIKMFSPEPMFNGLRVVLDRCMESSEWEFPYDRFIEYGKEDLWWAIPQGFGRWVMKPWDKAYRVGDSIVMHPAMWDKLKTHLDKQRESYMRMTTAPIPRPVSLFA